MHWYSTNTALVYSIFICLTVVSVYSNEKAREVYEETKLRLKAKREKKKLAEKQKVANDKAQMENEIEVKIVLHWSLQLL